MCPSIQSVGAGAKNGIDIPTLANVTVFSLPSMHSVQGNFVDIVNATHTHSILEVIWY